MCSTHILLAYTYPYVGAPMYGANSIPPECSIAAASCFNLLQTMGPIVRRP
jgi:hypothetical protein